MFSACRGNAGISGRDASMLYWMQGCRMPSGAVSVSYGKILRVSTSHPDPPPPEPNLTPDPHGSAALGPLARFAAAVAAVVSGAAGIYGVFREGTNTGGVPILLVLAAFFGYLAISGQRLTRVKIGDNEAGFDRVVNVLSHRILENPALSVETKGEVAEALEEVGPALSRRTRRVVGAALNAQEMAER